MLHPEESERQPAFCVRQLTLNAACTAPSGSGTCKNTDKKCDGGVYVPGYCPGPSTVQCCVTKTTQPPSGGDLAAFDISSAQPAAFWTCAGNKYKKAVIRGYQQVRRSPATASFGNRYRQRVCR